MLDVIRHTSYVIVQVSHFACSNVPLVHCRLPGGEVRLCQRELWRARLPRISTAYGVAAYHLGFLATMAPGCWITYAEHACPSAIACGTDLPIALAAM